MSNYGWLVVPILIGLILGFSIPLPNHNRTTFVVTPCIATQSPNGDWVVQENIK